MQNPQLYNLINKLKIVGKKNNIPLWLTIAELLERPRSKRAEVNIYKLAKYTHEGSKVIVPGKVLGVGDINHKIILASLSISKTAAEKIKKSGGIIMSIEEMVDKFPDGKEVIIIG